MSDLSNYDTKKNRTYCKHWYTLILKKDFVVLKAEFDKLEISKQTNVPTSLNNLKNKVHGLDVCKLKTVPVDLKTWVM